MDAEQKALQICEQAQNQQFRYMGPDTSMKGRTGRFEVLDDLNCCCPTNNVLFSFQSTASRKVMNAEELISFYQDCQPLH